MFGANWSKNEMVCSNLITELDGNQLRRVVLMLR